LGDSAYRAMRWVVPPFKDYGNLEREKNRFNTLHKKGRRIVENAFGLFKGRFRRFGKFTEQTDLRGVTNLIFGGCFA